MRVRACLVTLVLFSACEPTRESDPLPCSSLPNVEIGDPYDPGDVDTEGALLSPTGQGVHEFAGTGITFRSDFAGGRLSDVLQVDPLRYTLRVDPETCPINDSAWYAFEARAATPSGIEVTLSYTCGSHRYVPKQSRDGTSWVATSDSVSPTFSITLDGEPTWVAAQELVTSDAIRAWVDRVAAHPWATQEIAGTTPRGRRIMKVVIGGRSGDWVVLMGRQHPPEVTGQIALQKFVDRIAADDSLAVRFRERYSVVAYPLANPDGVELGHWRANLYGVDLNRDWGPFKQAETAALRDDILTTAGGRAVFAIDFHSTRSNRFYLPPDPGELPSAWVCDIAEAHPEIVYRMQTVASAAPMASIWLGTRLGAQAVTYEVGDDIDRATLGSSAAFAADALMERLLSEADAARGQHASRP